MRHLLYYFSIFLTTICFYSCDKLQHDKKLLAYNTVPNHVDSLIKVEPFLMKRSLSFLYKEEIKKSIERYYQNNWVRNNLSGSFLVAKNGEVIYENWQGISDKALKKEITKFTPLHIASVSKVLTATAILKLIDANRLSLDQKVNTILPEFPYEDITIKMLLNHRSGLPHYSNFTTLKWIWNSRELLSNQAILDLLAKHKFKQHYHTDTRFNYCNTNYVMLALIIEKVTGLNFREAMKKMVFEPLNMKNTYIFNYRTDKDTCSQSYIGAKKYEFNYLDDVYGDKNAYSTPGDLLKFDMATYSPKFLNKSLREQLYTGYSKEIKGVNDYGLGIRMSHLLTGKTIHFHNGWWHGNTSSYVTIKNDTITIIALSNRYTKIVYNARGLHTLFDMYNMKPTIK